MNSAKFYHQFLAMIFIILYFSSCQQAQESKPAISPNDREWMTQFFTDIMLMHHGIYTLWGAHKPITIVPFTSYTSEEKKAIYDSFSEEEKNEGCTTDTIEGYDDADAWEKWEQISHRFPLKRFMLFKQEGDDPHHFFVIFIDIIKTATVIQDNYEAFQKAMGFDFHPLELTLQMNQKDSVFWKNLNSYLYGLLCGFGKTNSQIFHWKNFDHPKTCNALCNNIKPKFANGQFTGHIKFTVDNLLLPSFASFNEIDPIVMIYKQEREFIKENYKNKDFLDLTLQKITSN